MSKRDRKYWCKELSKAARKMSKDDMSNSMRLWNYVGYIKGIISQIEMIDTGNDNERLLIG